MDSLVRLKEDHVTTTVLQELEASFGTLAAEPILSNVAASELDPQIFNNVSYHIPHVIIHSSSSVYRQLAIYNWWF
jgi:hypothetical protein